MRNFLDGKLIENSKISTELWMRRQHDFPIISSESEAKDRGKSLITSAQ